MGRDAEGARRWHAWGMANLYLSDELGSPTAGAVVTVSGAEARHAVTVNRLGIGERVTVGDGMGTIVDGSVTAVAPAEFSFAVESVATHDRPAPGIWLAQALAKGDRDEFAIQAATELGVDGVIPWAAARSISRWEGAKVAKNQARWEAIVREATKQSARPWIPEVSPLVTTRQLAALCASAQVVVLDPLSDTALSAIPTSVDSRDIVLVVGPEGGIAPNELDLLYGAGATGARLGDGILRTSTAGPAAIAVLSAKLRNW